jgi:hypothetical protein
MFISEDSQDSNPLIFIGFTKLSIICQSNIVDPVDLSLPSFQCQSTKCVILYITLFCVFEVVLQTISDVYIYYWTRCYEYSLKTARWMLNNVQSILGWKYKLESIWHTSKTSTYRQIMWHWMCLHRGVEGSPPPPRNHKRTHTLLWQKLRRSWSFSMDAKKYQ